jgi:hypothetical protein
MLQTNLRCFSTVVTVGVCLLKGLQHLRRHRPVVSPNEGFLVQLALIEVEVLRTELFEVNFTN